MKKTLMLLLVVASIALMITGCCLGKDDIVEEPDSRYLLKYKSGDTLFYKANNGQVDTLMVGGGIDKYDVKYYDCYTKESKVYFYSYNHIYPAPYASFYIYADYEDNLRIGTIDINKDKFTIIDTIVNNKHYREMYHFYTERHHEKTIPSYLLYDLTYNTGIVQYRDTLGVMWTLQE